MAKKVVILGAGYAGLVCALELNKLATSQDAEIVLVNKHDYHQLITQLHEPAVGAKKQEDITVSLNSVLGSKPIKFIKDTVVSINKEQQSVELEHSTIAYDYLVVALGSETEFFGIPGLKEYSFTMKSVNQANRIREHIEKCFENYSKEKRDSMLTFVVGGAGFSGIELVGELADKLPELTAKYNVPKDKVKVFSVEAAPSIMPGFDPELVDFAKQSLEQRGVKFSIGTPVVQVEPGKVHLKGGDIIETDTMIWTGGVRGVQQVIDAGFETEPRGRAKVDEHMRALGHKNVWIIGDACFVLTPEGRPYPPTAQISTQMGANAAVNIYATMKHIKLEKFDPHLYGAVASLGRKEAVANLSPKFKPKGWVAYRIKDASKLRYLSTIGALFKK
ncbi:NAD(P)/FAD-dependent oxidoreductase [Tumebacillus sp. ITR2]|uniref:NAD(P)/FAD-dependent oxidoreductase n=1 Tax=Tumebacillus amylolyticus TaxID=2801339 RepID=A0ABS1J980_9BACL|nr:NAD(P)/FAD-dependent oxidoreductase [Tumebacillus amylolyticus]MBL0386599.1 NAD(P)/FAD-dependent oxidoreductase [Tumebacillus amylolyticus]